MIKSIAFRTVMSWAIYPFSWALALGVFAMALNGSIAMGAAPSILGLILIVFYVAMEQIIPYQQRWKMTQASLISDIKYLIANGAVGAIIVATLSYFTINAAGQLQGFASHWPLLLQLILCILIYESLIYPIHRAMHEAPGAGGRFLWQIHLAHHLPERVYLLMHAVFHPLNVLINNVITIIVPIWLMGYDPRVVTAFFLINTLHGLISHFNVDVRMGWMNYVFVGTELHRYHHSADMAEAKNFGALIPIYDLLLGTFVYKPGIVPQKLGLEDGPSLPYYGEYLKVLVRPFK